MTTDTYNFQEKLREGQRHERRLDKHYEKRFLIRPATAEEERQGIDRHFTARKTGLAFTVQYKADSTAARTGNAFVEYVSVDRGGIPGWAITCRADYIIYYVAGRGPAYVIRTTDLQCQLVPWARQYESRTVPNEHYNTVGLIVPLDELEEIAYAISDI